MRPYKNVHETNANTVRELMLLVNDDLLAETILVHMQKKGFCVDTHYNLESLQKKLQDNHEPPDVLVFDMDFFEFTAFQEINDSSQKRMKLIAISGHNDMDVRLKAVRANVSSFVPKPLDVHRLATQIHKSLALKKRKIYSVLIIDDSITDFKLYQHILESQGIRVRFLEDPLHMLKEIEQYKPDLTLIDYHMPKANGLDILKVIRQVYSRKDLPILFMTGSKDPEILSAMRQETHLEPIDKSLSHDDFLARVFGVLE